MLCEAITARIVPSLDRAKKAVLNPNLYVAVLEDFRRPLNLRL